MSFPEDKKSAASLADAAPVDDPWAKWRKPAGAESAPTEAAAVVEKKREARPPRSAESQARREPRSEAPRAAPAPPVTRSEPLPETPAAPPSGTLTVRKAPPAAKPARGEPRPPKRPPLRGGPPRDYRVSERQPRAERPEGAARTDKPRDKAPARPAAENPWAKARPVRSETPRPERAPAAPSTVPAGEAPQGVRLSKVMSTRGLCSRREADLWIERGWVFVNGEQVSELGTRIDADAEVTISREAELNQAKQVTILIHKPVGYVSGQPEPGCVPAVTLISAETQMPQPDCPEFKPWMLRGLAPAGRLDVDSTGLLVLTQDGRVARKLIGEDSDVEKEYLVRVSGQMIKNGLDLLRHGLELDGKPLRQAWVKQLNEDQLHFILKEGKKRQIRRMCELVGLTVIGLKRVRIGRIRLGDLPMGQWRFLREGEAF